MSTGREGESGQETGTLAYCSFCGKPAKSVGPLIEGPDHGGAGPVYICGECIELCASILKMEKQRREAGDTPDKMIDDTFADLPEREREAIKLLIGLGGGYTYSLEQVAAKHDLPIERVREIEKSALARLGPNKPDVPA